MDRFEEINNYITELLNDIDSMKCYKHKMICLFSLIDSFVQNYSKYDTLNLNDHFCNFILKFVNTEKYPFLEEIDPVTLLYDINGEKIKIKELVDANIYSIESKEIIDLRQKIDMNTINEKIKNRHKYVKLIYCSRSKVTHEGQLTGLIGVETENKYNYPIYLDFSDFWKLTFPYEFLKELFVDCINNYLKYQKENNNAPFDNNFERKSFYAFYD